MSLSRLTAVLFLAGSAMAAGAELGVPQQLSVAERRAIDATAVPGTPGYITRRLEFAGADDPVELKHDRSAPMWLDPHGHIDRVRYLTCQSDLVVRATVSSLDSYLAPDARWILTEVNLTVHAVLKEDASARSRPGEFVRLLRIGGRIEVDGRQVLMPEFPWLPPVMPGDQLLAFLGRRVSQTGTYLDENALLALGESAATRIQREKRSQLRFGEIGRADREALASIATAAIASQASDPDCFR